MRAAIPKKHQTWLKGYLERKSWKQPLDPAQYKIMRVAYRQMLHKQKPSGIDLNAIYTELRKLPKRLTTDTTLVKALDKVLGMMGGTEPLIEPLIEPLGWIETDYIYAGHKVGAIRFCKASIWIRYRVEMDGKFLITDKYVNKKYYCDDEVEALTGYGKSLFTSRALYDIYNKAAEANFYEYLTTTGDTSKARTILGVGNTATRADIKQAYKKLANLHHPDKGGDVAFMVELNAAKDALLKR